MKYLPLVLAFCAPLAQAVEVGQPLPGWALEDQFEQASVPQPDLRVMLVARNMDAARLLEAAMETRPKGWLAERHVLFVADVSRMPSLVASLFALPAMRDYSYRVVLDREPSLVPKLNAPEEGILWLELRGNQVLGRQVFTDSAVLGRALERLQP